MTEEEFRNGQINQTFSVEQRNIMIEEKHPGGRPTIYNEEMGIELCARMVGADNGKPRSLVSVCNDSDMPNFRTIMKWLANEKFPEFVHRYHEARKFRTEAIFEEMRDIARTPLIGEVSVEKETKDGTFMEKRMSDNVQRSDLMVKTAMWQLARMEPKKYGDKFELSGDQNNPISHKITVGTELAEVLTLEQLEEIRQRVISKSNFS